MNTLIDAYMDGLRRNRAKISATVKPHLTLTEEIKAWWEGQSELNRFPGYSMRFLVNTFGYAPGKIGPALFELGWTRRRSWERGKPFCRVWVPPRNSEKGDVK